MSREIANPKLLEALVAQAKAEALRSQRDFFLAIGLPVAADHCEQSAVGWDTT